MAAQNKGSGLFSVISRRRYFDEPVSRKLNGAGRPGTNLRRGAAFLPGTREPTTERKRDGQKQPAAARTRRTMA
jgi:hypothetical protein